MGIFCTNITADALKYFYEIPRSWYYYYYAYARQTQVNWKNKIVEKTKRGKGYYIPIQDHLCQAKAGAHCSYLLWAIYMAVSMPGHDDLTAFLIIPNGFIVTLWAPAA